MASKIWRWMTDRLGLRQVRQQFLNRRVTKEPWYNAGGEAMLLLFAIQLVTGIVLAFSYTPSTEGAYESVRQITFDQTLGWFVRGLHYWSGGLWVALLFYHMMRQAAIGGYKKPREGTWLIGVLLLYVVLVMSFIGYVLRWDERGVYAIRVAMNIFYKVPWIGDELVLLVQGGPMLGDQTLSRLYAVHVVLGPLLLIGLIGYHVYLVVVHGTVSEAETEQPVETAAEQKRLYEQEAHTPHRGETFYPKTIVRLSPFPLAALAAAVGLTLLLGARELYPPANLVADSRPREEWWFAWYSALTALLPSWAAQPFHVLFPIVVFLVLVLLPFMDRGETNRGAINRPVAVTLVGLCVLAVLTLSALRVRSAWTAWPSQTPPSLPPTVEPTERVERGRVLFATYGCYNCHAVAGEGPKFGPDMARLRERYSLEGLRRYILNPPEGVPMPSYEGKISEEDLELVAEFCHVVQTLPRGR